MKFKFLPGRFRESQPRILDLGCGYNTSRVTKHWFPGCYYAGADIQKLSVDDEAAMDRFYLLSESGAGLETIPNAEFDLVILNHVLEHIYNPEPLLDAACRKLKPGGYIWIAFPSVRSLSLPASEGTLHFCDDPTHVRVPDIREVSNILLKDGVKILHAGRSHHFVKTVLGAILLPYSMLRRIITGRRFGRGLWFILGFEDHVFGILPRI